MAKKVLENETLKTKCGTQEFMAPEVLVYLPAYNKSCDMWSVGVIVFILLGGYYPFGSSSDKEEQRLTKLRHGDFKFRKKFWKGISAQARSLVKKMLTVTPGDRITAENALNHKWISEVKNLRKIFKGAVKALILIQKWQQSMNSDNTQLPSVQCVGDDDGVNTPTL